MTQSSAIEALRSAGEGYRQARESATETEVDAAMKVARSALRALNENLSGADLSNATLQRFFLSSFHGDGANFTDADLTDATCYFGSWVRAKFVRANLTGVTFAHANCRDADFRGAILRSADFNGADLAGAKFDPEQLVWLAEQSRKGCGTPISWPEGMPDLPERTYEGLGAPDIETAARELEEIAKETPVEPEPAPAKPHKVENLSLF